MIIIKENIMGNFINEQLERKMQEAFTESINYGRTKYGKYLEMAKKNHFEAYQREMTKWQEHNLVRSLMNMEKDFIGQFGEDRVRKAFTESTTTPDAVGKFINYSFGMATAMVPDSIMEKFTSVQTMDKRVGEVFFMNILRGTTKGVDVAGSKYMDAMEGMKTSGNYTSTLVDIEEQATGDGSTLTFDFTLSYKPLVAGEVTLNFTVAGSDYSVKDNGSGVFVADTNIDTGSTVNYSTGVVHLVFKAGRAPDATTKVSTTYYYNSAVEDGQVVTLTAELTSTVLTAQRRAVNLKYLFDAALMLNREHGIDLEAELLEKATAGVMNEIAVSNANKIYEEAQGGASEIVFSKTPPSTQIPYIIHRQEIIGKIADGALTIEQGIRYAKARTIIGGRDFVSLVRGLPNDVFQKVDYSVNPVGMHVVGVLDGQYEVIQNLDFYEKTTNVSDRFTLIAHGTDNLHTGSIFAEYIPLTVLNANWNNALDIFRSAVTWNAFKVINNKFFVKGKITA